MKIPKQSDMDIVKSLIHFYVKTYIIHYTFNGNVFKTNPICGLSFVDTLKILAEADGKVFKIEDCA